MDINIELLFVIVLAVMIVLMLVDWLALRPSRVKNYGPDYAKKYPWYTRWAFSFFWVVLLVFVIRSFVIEPFRIPSGSMLPTLESGDMILVNKFSYGLKLPLTDKKIVDFGGPKKGDIVVFKYPLNTSTYYVKRVVGTPGDVITYSNTKKMLNLNGQTIEQKDLGPYINPEQPGDPVAFQEALPGHSHRILKENRLTIANPQADGNFVTPDSCRYASEEFQCKVPEGYYFVMGDNRDNSADSRFWGFVPENYVSGRVFGIWFNMNWKWGRIGAIEEE